MSIVEPLKEIWSSIKVEMVNILMGIAGSSQVPSIALKLIVTKKSNMGSIFLMGLTSRRMANQVYVFLIGLIGIQVLQALVAHCAVPFN